MNSTLTPLENAVLEMLLFGGATSLQILRSQLAGLRVSAREHTGVGFFTSFQHDNETPRVNNRGRIMFGDVNAALPGLVGGAGFLLYVQDGWLSALEAYTYDEAWPQTIDPYRLAYAKEPRDALEKFVQKLDQTS